MSVFKYHFGAILNHAFSFVSLLRSDGGLLKMLILAYNAFSERMRG
jgi:hypothetical protein